MSRPPVTEAAFLQTAPAETVSPAVPAADWLLRLVTIARRSPGVGSHLTVAALLLLILAICMRTGIVPMRSYVHDIVFFADNA